MSKFEFKYLNGAEVKRIQNMVSMNSHQLKNPIVPVMKEPTTDIKAEKNEISTQSRDPQPVRIEKPKQITPRAVDQRDSRALSINSPREKPSASKLNRPLKNIDNILAKITLSQQSICASVDLIIPKLLEKKAPVDELEKTKFQTRFSDFLKVFTRNYMYQIKKSIDGLESNYRLTEVEFSLRVCSLFNILQIALSTYIRSLRYFVSKGVPGKVIQLLQSIQRATQTCVERNIFDQDDVVVKMLLEKIEDVIFRVGNIDLLKLLVSNSDVQRFMQKFEQLATNEPEDVKRVKQKSRIQREDVNRKSASISDHKIRI